MDFFKLTVTVLGGLSIFIYGMGLMSEGLTQVAGARFKAALGFMTRNRVAAILAGAGITALAMVVDTGHTGLVKKLVEAGADLAATDKDGNAIVHYAAKGGNISVLNAVVAGAPLNVKNSCGNTPLAAAGADYSVKDLIIAESADHVAVAQWLVNQGLDVNAEGVMAAACPATQTGRYLVAEGGVAAEHACEKCQPKDAEDANAADAKEPEHACKPVPVDVLLVPQCAK